MPAPSESPRWVDTHCHLQLTDAEPRTLLDRAADVEWVVVPGIDLASSLESLALAELFPGRVLPTAGLHPHDADRWPQEADAIAGLLDRVAAVGECGLDFYRNLSPAKAQRTAFSDQLALAADARLPVIVHTRDAFADVHDLVSASGHADHVVLHCWTGGPRWTKRFLDLPVTFSFAGPVAFETGDTVRRGAALVPPERCLVETDTPYLSPPPFRGEPNEPGRVALVGAALATLWGLGVDEVADLTRRRANEVFGRA
jgi:TatD DNase family protein